MLVWPSGAHQAREKFWYIYQKVLVDVYQKVLVYLSKSSGECVLVNVYQKVLVYLSESSGEC
jgi:hypothetical protein